MSTTASHDLDDQAVSTVETAATSPRSWLTPNMVAIGLASFFSDVSHEMATTILPVFLATQMGASAVVLGLIEGVADGLASYFKLVGGWVTDRMGRRKPAVVSGYLLTTLATSSFALALHWTMILASRTLAWVARGFRTPGRNALLADSVEQPYYGRAFGFERAMDTVGAVVGPLLALGLVSAGFGYRWVFAVTLIPGLLAVSSMAFLVQEQLHAPRAEARLWGEIKRLPRHCWPLLLVIGIFGLGQFAPTLLVLRATELLTPAHGATVGAKYAMGLYMFFNIVQAASSYTIGRLSQRLGSVKLLGVGYTLFAAAAIGFAVTGAGWMSLIGWFMLAGIAVGIIEAMEPTVTAELLPEDLRGTGFGVLGAANGIGDFLSSALVGGLWTAFGATAGFGAAALCNAASVVLLLSMPPASGDLPGLGR
ncbi:MAG: MFS transporter [Acidobacteriota bacterium]|nr:MFS transporter [Blastocatellia bacterium]MDW8238223.1 MFS transporter [Acidobacteriota bacterium]